MGRELDGEPNLQHMLVINERLSKRMGEGARQMMQHNAGAAGTGMLPTI